MSFVSKFKVLSLPLLVLLAACSEGGKAEDDGPAVDPNANADGDCLTDAEERTRGTNPNATDSDGDTLSDCDEIEIGSNPTSADSDADGLNDADEVACVSSPTDANERCYACGWQHNDPGNLASNGSAEGNVIGDMQLVDQCEETVSLWDFASTPDSPVPTPSRYHILFMTAAW
jgi:hypothetical protein